VSRPDAFEVADLSPFCLLCSDFAGSIVALACEKSEKWKNGQI